MLPGVPASVSVSCRGTRQPRVRSPTWPCSDRIREAGLGERCAVGCPWRVLLAVLVMVIVAVAVELIRALASRPHTGGTIPSSSVASFRVPRVSDTHSGMPPSPAQDMVLRAWTGAVHRARAAFGSRLAARTWEESMTARDHSNFSVPCGCCHTPARSIHRGVVGRSFRGTHLLGT